MRKSITPVAVAALLSALAPALADAPEDNLNGQVLLQADEVDYDMDNSVVSARGHVEIDDAGKILLAERVDYDQKKDTVTASGHVSVLDEKGNVAFADHVTLSDKMREGALSTFSALIGKTGRVAAASARRIGGRYTIANHVAYTPCKICSQPGHRTPLWRVRARRVVYDEQKHEFYFHNASIEFFGVPLLYSPYLSEPDPSVKYASGILTPTLGNSTSVGYDASVAVDIAL